MQRKLCTKNLYQSSTDLRWMIQNNNIKNCDITVRYIDSAQEIWGKDIDSLKDKTTRTKLNMVAGDTINITKELINLNKKCISQQICFSKWDTIFISLIHKIDFTGASNFP